MKRRTFVASAVATACLPLNAVAQGAGRMARIGWLTAQQAASVAPYLEAFRAGLAELGHVEGRNIAIEVRYGDGAIGRMSELAAELMRLPIDLLVTTGGATFEVRKLGLPIPIVYVISADPVVAGYAESLSRPLGNMTGVTLMAVEVNRKRLELLREIVPSVRRVAVIGNPEHPGAHLELAFSEETARDLGLTIDYRPTSTREELAKAFVAMAADPPQAISILADGFAIQNRQNIINFATRHSVPAVSGWPIFARSGAICTFGPRIADANRRVAYFVNQILKGAKPRELPVERPTKFELVLNQRAAQGLGIRLPQSLVVSADEVIE